MSLASAEVLNFTIPDLLRLLYAVLMLGRFSSGLDTPCLDADTLRASAILGGYYIDALVGKFRDTLAQIGNPTEHHLVYLGRIFADSKSCLRPATAGAIAITEDLFTSTPKKLTEKPSDRSAECCIDVPDEYDNCPDFDSAFNKHFAASDSADPFIDWGDATA